jgi:hypothetical protein
MIVRMATDNGSRARKIQAESCRNPSRLDDDLSGVVICAEVRRRETAVDFSSGRQRRRPTCHFDPS